MFDVIAIAAPVGHVLVAFHQTYPEAVGGLAAALLALVLDGLTPHIKILSSNPWLVNILRAGISRVGVAVRDAGSKR
jgi:hypothetical protein